jgi:AcrR family transcriptional regulator
LKKANSSRADPDFRDKLRGTLMQIGRRLIEQEGVASLQARRIASEAGCAVGSIYNVFEDLDDLVIQINMHTLYELGGSLTQAHKASRNETTYDRLLALADAYFQFAEQHQRLWRAIFEHRLPEGRKVPAEYRDDQARLFALVEECLVNELVDTNERKSAARALFASVHGIVSLSLDRKLGEFQAQETRRQIEFLIGCATRGLERS